MVASSSFTNDGIQVFDLPVGELHAAECLAVEETVVVEEIFDAAAVGADLDLRIELVAAFGFHALDENSLAVAQRLLLVVGQDDALDVVGNECRIGTHRDHLVGQFVEADERWYVLAAAGLELHHAAHVACLQQVLFVLFGEDVPEVGPVQFGLLADAVDRQNDGAADGLLKREPGVGAQDGRAEVHRNGHGLVGLISPEHLVEKPFLFQKLAGKSVVLQLLPVDHRLVVTILGLCFLRGGSRTLRCHARLFFLFCHVCVFWFGTLMLYLMVLARTYLVCLEKFLHSRSAFPCGEVFERLPVLRLVELFIPHRKDAPAGRVFDLTPEILQKVFYEVGVLVDFEKRIAVLSFGLSRPITAVLFDLRHGLQQQLHLVEDEDDVGGRFVLRDGCRRSVGRCVVSNFRLCHNL